VLYSQPSKKSPIYSNRCAIYESLYVIGNTPKEVLSNFHTALVELYATILRSMALAHHLFDRTTTIRTIYAIHHIGQISRHLENYPAVEERVEIEAQNCERKRSREADSQVQELLENLKMPVFQIDETVCSLLQKVDDSERLKILDWISNVLYGKNHDNVRGQRSAGTCEWLLRHDRFQEWQNESSSTILWLHGTGRSIVFI
jgi:hypothetical protein